jgi:hypothetical protein
LQARAAGRDAKEGTNAAREAKASLESALRENPLLAREKGAALAEAERALTQSGPK